MAIELPIPDSAYETRNISLSGVVYDVTFRFNNIEKKDEDDSGTWYIDIQDTEGNYLIRGLGIVGEGELTKDLIIDNFTNGGLYCVRKEKTDLRPTRNNLGIGKAYGLFFVSNEEFDNA